MELNEIAELLGELGEFDDALEIMLQARSKQPPPFRENCEICGARPPNGHCPACGANLTMVHPAR